MQIVTYLPNDSLLRWQDSEIGFVRYLMFSHGQDKIKIVVLLIENFVKYLYIYIYFGLSLSVG